MMTLTPSLIYAASFDAGNRAMRRAGRNAWNESDRDAAFREWWRLSLACEYVTPEMARECGHAPVTP